MADETPTWTGERLLVEWTKRRWEVSLAGLAVELLNALEADLKAARQGQQLWNEYRKKAPEERSQWAAAVKGWKDRAEAALEQERRRAEENAAKATLAKAYIEFKSAETEMAILRGASPEMARRTRYYYEQARDRLKAAYYAALNPDTSAVDQGEEAAK